MKLSEIKLNPSNPRIIKDDKFRQLVKSIQDFPKMMAFRPIVVDDNNVTLGGNMRLKALQELKFKEIPDEWVKKASELTEEEKREFIIKDNVGFGEWEWEALSNEWDTDQLLEWGLDIPDFVNNKEAVEDDYVIPDEIETDIVLGDLFDIGQHRLLCGDSTKAEDVAKLMNEQNFDLCFTSPPYAEQRKQQYGGIPEHEYYSWFSQVETNITDFINQRGNFILNIKPNATKDGRTLYVLELICSLIKNHGWILNDEFIWLRTGIPKQVIKRFKNAFEPCYWFVKTMDFKWFPNSVKHYSENVPKAKGKGAGNISAALRQGKGGGAVQGNEIGNGMAYPTNVLDFKQNAEAIGHPAAFPVQLPSFFVKCMTTDGNIVYDPFLGSGTTMVAAHQLNRKCYGMEIEPKYVQICIDRMKKLDSNIEIKKNGEPYKT